MNIVLAAEIEKYGALHDNNVSEQCAKSIDSSHPSQRLCNLGLTTLPSLFWMRCQEIVFPDQPVEAGQSLERLCNLAFQQQ